MKNKKFIFICLLILAIGFAAVSTTLYISGNLVFGTNKNDFDIYFSGAIVDDEDKSNEVIFSDKKHIEYETKELKKLGDRSVLEFEVTNNSTQYDAKVSISCILSDNEYITYTTDSNEYNIPAQTRESGKVIVELIKASTRNINPTISCELISRAQERSATAETAITDSSYEITGTLTDEEGNILANKNLVVYSETPHYVTTDDYGFFYVNGLEKGSHEIYYVNEKIVEGKTKEEVKELAEAETKITTSSTKINFENIKLNDFKINVEKEEEINITLDADTGSIDSNTLKLNKYHKGSELPTPTPKSNNYEFLGWYDGEKKITKNTIITSDMNLVAKWNKKCQYDEGFVWNYDYIGGEQTFTVPCDGEYKLETWGAEGGYATNYLNTLVYLGGKGGYSKVVSSFQLNDNLYINVGGKGIDDCVTYYCSGGYNGGGKAGGQFENSVYKCTTGSGGGASHIATKSGLLSLFVNDKSSVIVVAGGGGGSISHRYNDSYNWWTAYGGAGGGLTSELGILPVTGRSTPATVATQTSAGCGYNVSTMIGCGSFGQGMDSNGGVSLGSSAGAGGGWFGGGSSIYGTTTGGSSYIKAGLEGSTISGKSTMPSYDGTSTMIGNSGNGYARITLVSID